MRHMTVQASERLDRSKLRAFYEEIILPRLQRDGASSSHRERHAAAVEHLERFCKRPLSPDEVDAELVAQFESYLWRQGTSEGRRRDLVESLCRICRAYQPGPRVTAKRCKRRPLPDPPPGSLRHFYETVDIPQRLAGRSKRYIDENRAAFWQLYEHYGRDLMLKELCDALMAEHRGWLLDKGLRPATVNTGHTAPIFATWRYAAEQGLVDRKPTLRKLPETRDEPDAWSVGEIQQLIAACQGGWMRPEGGRIAGIPAGDWYEALLRVAWYTALRKRAILGLVRADVDLRHSRIRVPGRLMKNGRGQSFKLGADAVAAIAKIWKPERELLFPFPHFHKTFYVWFNRILKASGIPRGNHCLSALHKIRRSAATLCAQAKGMSAAQTILGHADRRMTERYVDPSKLPHYDYSDVLSVVAKSADAVAEKASGTTTATGEYCEENTAAEPVRGDVASIIAAIAAIDDLAELSRVATAVEERRAELKRRARAAR